MFKKCVLCFALCAVPSAWAAADDNIDTFHVGNLIFRSGTIGGIPFESDGIRVGNQTFESLRLRSYQNYPWPYSIPNRDYASPPWTGRSNSAYARPPFGW